MLLRHLTSPLCTLLVLQLSYLPQVLADEATTKIARKPASATVSAVEVQTKLNDLFGMEGNDGWDFRNQAGQTAALQNLITSGAKEFRLISPSTGGKRLGMRLKLVSPKDGSNQFSIAFEVQDDAFKKTLSRRLIRLDATKPAADNLVEIQQTIKSMNQEVGAALISSRSGIFELTVPRAMADDAGIQRLLQIAFWGGIGLFALPFLLTLQVDFGQNEKAAKIFYGVWFGSLAVAGLALAIDYVSFGKLPFQRPE